jgi:hypothetical protein
VKLLRRNPWLPAGVSDLMANDSRIRFAFFATLLGLFAMAGVLGAPQRAWAQERGSRDDEGRGGWRERYRDRGGDSERGRDSRDGRSRDEESRRGDSSNGSSSSSGSSSTASTETKPSSGGSSGSLNMADYAKSLVKQYDKNDNKMLEADERKELRGRAAEADLNKDNVITIDELVAHLSSSTPATPTSTTSSSTSAASSASGGDKAKSDSDKAKRVRYGSAGGAAASSKEGDKRHSYRFTPATQKLPSGLPGWFTSKDSNRDGQVSMSEYGRSWSERSVADFRKIDVNNDGVITPKEASKSSSSG